MSFVVFKGTAEVIENHDGFQKGNSHGYVCVVPEKELNPALAVANQKAKNAGFVIKTVDGPVKLISTWRSWLLTKQGRDLRESKKHGALLVFSKESS